MKVLLVCNRHFNATEVLTTARYLKRSGIEFDVISLSEIVQAESGGKWWRTTFVFEENEPDPDKYDGLLMTSGYPEDSKFYWSYKPLRTLVESFANKPVGAICASTANVRYIANGKRVACYPLLQVQELLSMSGAILQDMTLVVDGNLVTAESDFVADVWIEAYCKVLQGEDPQLNLKPVGDFRYLKPRQPPEGMKGRKDAHS